jgi:hypothetical protein
MTQSNSRTPIAIDAYVKIGHQSNTTLSNNKIYSVLNAATASLDVLIGRPYVTYNNVGAITIQVAYYCRSDHNTLTSLRIMQIHEALTAVIDGAPITLNFTYVSMPYMDATILARYVSDELMGHTFNQIARKLLSISAPLDNAITKHVNLPAHLLGLSISLNGRLSMEPTRPRMTKQFISIGSLAPSPNAAIQIGSYTAVNAKGSYTVSICLSTKLSLDPFSNLFCLNILIKV